MLAECKAKKSPGAAAQVTWQPYSWFLRDEVDLEQGVSSQMETRDLIQGDSGGEIHRTQLREREASRKSLRYLICRT